MWSTCAEIWGSGYIFYLKLQAQVSEVSPDTLSDQIFSFDRNVIFKKYEVYAGRMINVIVCVLYHFCLGKSGRYIKVKLK